MSDYIMSLRIARKLLSDGCKIIDVQPSQRLKGRLVFVFRDASVIENKLAEYRLYGEESYGR